MIKVGILSKLEDSQLGHQKDKNKLCLSCLVNYLEQIIFHEKVLSFWYFWCLWLGLGSNHTIIDEICLRHLGLVCFITFLDIYEAKFILGHFFFEKLGLGQLSIPGGPLDF